YRSRCRKLRRSAGQFGGSPNWDSAFHFDNGADEFFLRPLWARPTSTLRREQHAVLALPQQVVEIQQSGALQHNPTPDKACRANEQGTQTGDDPIRSAQLGRTFASAI